SNTARDDDGAAPLSAEQQALVERLVGERLVQEQVKTEEANTRWQRTQADFANYKRRNEQEREQQGRFANLVLVSELLPVLDDLDRAMATIPDAVQALPWTDGLRLVDRNLRGTLEKQGLQPIEAVGAKFDPMLHEAIIHEESPDHDDDEVIAELRRGYILHDRVVRPTLVKVAKHVEPAEETE
ncbi:MAG: nucleotide exchange factor GrpE, partial [Chloroflexota bacterium]